MAGSFTLPSSPLLSRSTVDRHESRRLDVARQQSLWPGARVLLLDGEGRTPVRGGALALRPSAEVAAQPPVDAVLLGESGDTAYWAAPREHGERVAGEHWRDLRGCGADLDDTDAGLFTTAVAVLRWHDRAGFCAICGSPTAPRFAGWARYCLRCGNEEYPRTDPAVICLVHDAADAHVLLARQSSWPPGRFSVLAGFVEAGESLESCVIREVAEEVGVEVRDVRYLGSQPWPFPRSVMIGFAAVADRDAPLRPADGEIAQARWVSRDELRAALAEGGWTHREDGSPGSAVLLLPGEISIARRMLDAWCAARP
ncbi:MAG: NAD(+) diphosphatase [Pseudonocardiaceae bacterium]|nr:NAD(+) diphosphatase [Pseudonocardiaceae bacterium]